jgi:RNA polymerase sigma factor (sigma-70 family)
MARQLGKVIRHLRGALARGDEEAGDGQLLERFLARHDEGAFEVLVRRHGAMVLATCRRVLRNSHDAEDAFQATFLLLARRAAAVRQRGSLGSFLYAVARNTALHARRAAARRKAKEANAMPRPEPRQDAWDGLREALDEELARLPEKYRVPVLLCDLEGLTRKQAARRLGVPEGTVAGRLARARALLARRLSRHGPALSGAALAVALSGEASAAVPATLVGLTVRVAALVAAGQAPVVTTAAGALMKEVMKTMLLTKLKLAVGALMVAAALGAGSLIYRAAGQAPGGERRAEARPLTEVEVLRREVEILKLQMEVMQAKVRVLEGRPGGAPAGAGGPMTRPAIPAGYGTITDAPRSNHGPNPQPAGPAFQGQPPTGYGPGAGIGTAPAGNSSSAVPITTPAPAAGTPLGSRLPGPGAGLAPLAPGGRAGITPKEPRPHARISDPIREAEAALKAFGEAKDDAARQRAGEALERAVKKLRQHRRPDPKTAEEEEPSTP